MLTACAALCRDKEMVILGTQYAGEMKKGIFTVMHYLMPKRGILSLHSGCNVGKNDDVTLFFGLSGMILLLLLMQTICMAKDDGIEKCKGFGSDLHAASVRKPPVYAMPFQM